MSYELEYWDVKWTDDQWYSLHDSSKYVESIYGARTDVPSLRGGNLSVYGRVGQTHQTKIADQRSLTLRGWVSNEDSNGAVLGVDCEEGLDTNWRMLRRLLWREDGDTFQLRRRWHDENGDLITAIADVEYLSGLDLTQHVYPAGRWTCTLNMPDPYFYGVAENAQFVLDTPQVIVNSGDASATRLVAVFNDILENPELRNLTPDPDVWLRLGTSIADTDTVTADVDAFTVVRASDSANLIATVTRSGARPWLVLVPGNNNLELTATSGTGTVDLTWQPAYL
jgi:hypothetical protein